MQIAGGTAVVTVAGSCRDDSTPTDVEMRLPLGGTVPGTDVGAGNFEFTVDVTDTADEATLVVALGLRPRPSDSLKVSAGQADRKRA